MAPSPEAEQLLRGLQPGLATPGDPWPVVREKMEAIHPTSVPQGTEVERTRVGGVESWWISVPGLRDAERVLLHVHGGAFVSTGPEHYVRYATSLAEAFEARVLVPAYRLAPEHPCPAARDDALEAYRGLAAETPPERVAVSGDSCGGGIALAMLVRARAEGLPLPAAWIGLTPWLDLACEGDAARSPRGLDPFVHPEWIRERGRDYVGPDGDPRAPEASPLFADLTGLPPLYASVGSIDTTSDDATRLATAAARCGVAFQLELVAGMIHGFHGLAEMLPEGRQALERAGAWVRGLR